MISLAGLPAPAGVARGAPEPAASAPGASDDAQPRTPPVRPGAHVVSDPSTARRAGGPTTFCEHGPTWVTPAAVVYHGPRDEKVVALTFDDGWGDRTLRKILRVLREKHVNATFFPVGQAVRLNPKTWRRIAAAGFPIGDHTFDHRTLAGLCYPEQRHELARARHTYADVLEVTSLPVMRPPGGLWDDATRAAASSAGEPTIVLWDVDTRDWTGIGARRIRRNALAGTKGSIVVLHTSSLSTARALPGIIRGYRKRGFEFVTIGQLLDIAGPVPYTATAGAD
jgi:peptidoglycan/xylan/chitin deacetylase (PgdA/CDA1 family)